jgi:hypothetical protein
MLAKNQLLIALKPARSSHLQYKNLQQYTTKIYNNILLFLLSVTVLKHIIVGILANGFKGLNQISIVISVN